MTAADPLTVFCSACRAPAGTPCYTSDGATHKVRKKAAGVDRRVCRCKNHMGHAKIAHKTKTAALTWIMHRRQVRGMRMEVYPCPTSSAFHVRTAKTFVVR